MNLKKLICLLFALNFYVAVIVAQKGSIGVSFSGFSDNDVARFKSLLDDSSTSAGKSFTFGITYLKPLNKWLDFETGMEYISCSVEKSSMMSDINTGLFTSTRSSTMSLISAPLTVRANFLKYFFVNAGLILDLDVSNNRIVDSQTGVGTVFGLGVKYDFKSGISIFVNPVGRIHTFPLSDKYQEHLLESTVRFGVVYKL